MNVQQQESECQLAPVRPLRGLRGALRERSGACPNEGPKPKWLPPEQFHCSQDHYLQGKYGITCDDYWTQFKIQGGRCGVCHKPPWPGKRLVVDHDHDTGEIDGLDHFGCNRRIDPKQRRYIKNPPGRQLGLKVTPARLKAIQADDVAKRQRERERREAAKDQPQPTTVSNIDRLRAMTRQHPEGK